MQNSHVFHYIGSHELRRLKQLGLKYQLTVPQGQLHRREKYHYCGFPSEEPLQYCKYKLGLLELSVYKYSLSDARNEYISLNTQIEYVT